LGIHGLCVVYVVYKVYNLGIIDNGWYTINEQYDIMNNDIYLYY